MWHRVDKEAKPALAPLTFLLMNRAWICLLRRTSRNKTNRLTL